MTVRFFRLSAMLIVLFLQNCNDFSQQYEMKSNRQQKNFDKKLQAGLIISGAVSGATISGNCLGAYATPIGTGLGAFAGWSIYKIIDFVKKRINRDKDEKKIDQELDKVEHDYARIEEQDNKNLILTQNNLEKQQELHNTLMQILEKKKLSNNAYSKDS